MISVLIQWSGLIHPSINIFSYYLTQLVASMVLVSRRLSLTTWALLPQQQQHQLLAHLLTTLIIVTTHIPLRTVCYILSHGVYLTTSTPC
ncbi:hypothetical protein BJX63DRAFT_416908 [Aspergillus granulosus]|uniref:Uncharacterized protein n=1 Tax=Aspergillus granulosus TaxID=176169 RepID=A0ABR4GT45_9EURO